MPQSGGLRPTGISPALSPVGVEMAAAKSGWFPPESFLPAPSVVVNQGHTIPCCVSCAIATCVEMLHPAWEQLAPLFHYYAFSSKQQGERRFVFEEMSLAEGLSVLASSGICLSRFYDVPFTEEGLKVPPDEQAISDARSRTLPFDSNRELPGFAPLSDNDRVNGWKKIVLEDRAVLVGMYLTDGYGSSMRRLEGERDATRPHAVPILGYREGERAFLVQDSQGSEFALGGQWWLPYAMVESDVVEQAYVLGYPPS